MARIALLIDPSHDAADAAPLEELLRAEGHQTARVGEGGAEGVTPVDDASADAFDAAVVPGGVRRNQLRRHERFLSFLRDVYAGGKPVAVVHSDRWILAPGGPARGTWPAVKRELIVEPEARSAEDAFGAPRLVSGPATDVYALVRALFSEAAAPAVAAEPRSRAAPPSI